MVCCEISDCAQMSKTIIAVWHFGLGGRESLKTAVTIKYLSMLLLFCPKHLSKARCRPIQGSTTLCAKVIKRTRSVNAWPCSAGLLTIRNHLAASERTIANISPLFANR